jgi:hypothetical protein
MQGMRHDYAYGLVAVIREIVVLGSLTVLLLGIALAGDFPDRAHRVEREYIVAAMQRQADLGYDLKFMSHSTRFTTSVILDLVRDAAAERPDGDPLLVHAEDWYEAYRSVTHLEPAEVPRFLAIQKEYGQNRYLEYRPDRTRHRVEKGPQPDLAVRVITGWPDGRGVAKEYSFVDSLADPRMKVVTKRVLSYWLLEYPDMVVQYDIEGMRGRPLEGALGTLFKVVGTGRAVESRYAISDDGLQVTYAVAKKGIFSVDPVTVTLPEGKVESEIPEDRADLKAIAERLKQDIKIDFDD